MFFMCIYGIIKYIIKYIEFNMYILWNFLLYNIMNNFIDLFI